MKLFNPILIVTFLVLAFSCEKDKTISTDNPDVDQFIGLLRTEQYKSMDLPVFTYEDIPALLEYRNETQLVQNFPRNPLSSMYGPDCRLGVFVLWTIESIRKVPDDCDNMFCRFPSLNPILGIRESIELELVSDNSSHMVAAKAYFEWWEKNKTSEFSETRQIDPLADTDYFWH